MICIYNTKTGHKECVGKECPYYWEHELFPCTYGNKHRIERMKENADSNRRG